jgi:hypothetical protein
MLLAPVLTELAGNGYPVSYGDNTIILAPDEEGAVSMTEALWSALKAHPAGPLKPKIVGHQVLTSRSFFWVIVSLPSRISSVSIHRKAIA